MVMFFPVEEFLRPRLAPANLCLELGSVLTCLLAVPFCCWNVTAVGDGCCRRKNIVGSSSSLPRRGLYLMEQDLLSGADLHRMNVCFCPGLDVAQHMGCSASWDFLLLRFGLGGRAPHCRSAAPLHLQLLIQSTEKRCSCKNFF